MSVCMDVNKAFFKDAKEWNKCIDELKEAEIKLFKLKKNYRDESEKIIDETDFKSLYGRNNSDIRRYHIEHELKDMYEEIKNLEVEIGYLERRIDFLKVMVSDESRSRATSEFKTLKEIRNRV